MKITLIAFAVILLITGTFAVHNDPTTVDSTTSSAEMSSPSVRTVEPTTENLPSSASSSGSTSTQPPTAEPSTTSGSVPSTTQSSTAESITTTFSSVPTTTQSTTPETSVPTSTSSSSSEPTTSSKAPETTSVAPPTVSPTPSTETPTPEPVPETGYWNVTDGNTTCIRASLKVLFVINADAVKIPLSPTASSQKSKCNTTDGTEMLFLEDSDYNVIFFFEKSSDSVYVKNISFTYALPSAVDTVSNDTHFFEAKAGNSYLCKTASDVILGNVTMKIESIQIQAFGAENNQDFGSAEECGADNPINDIVPIAVGVALLALVVVVLIAYLVGRRRSRQKGYQSV